ncbi:hypothetical protein M3223_10200 [Paenibacillus pasadenensis]|nr:hypothetical protein [Paenibacillus pasadenensis]
MPEKLPADSILRSGGRGGNSLRCRVQQGAFDAFGVFVPNFTNRGTIVPETQNRPSAPGSERRDRTLSGLCVVGP